MNKKAMLVFISVLALIISMSTVVFAGIFVGVVKGNWIEYHITYVGAPDEEHDVIWAKMEIANVQGLLIYVSITVQYSNGKIETLPVILNLETGELGDRFIIPADLDIGDKFLDKTEGEIPISGSEERIFAGSKRAVVNTATSQTQYYWDKSTGVLLEASSELPDYTMHTRAIKTNMWFAEETDWLSIIIFASVLILMIGLVFTLVSIRKKKRTNS